MFQYSNKKRLHSFKAVRVLTPKDLYSRYGERVCVDKTDYVGSSRNPLERMDAALDIVKRKVSEDDYREYLASLEQTPPDDPPKD